MINKKGNMFFGVIIGIFIFVMGILFVPFVTDDISTTRTALNCSSTNITSGTMITCLSIDLVIPYFIWFFVSIVLGYIVGSLK
jgi:hypothetical protein